MKLLQLLTMVFISGVLLSSNMWAVDDDRFERHQNGRRFSRNNDHASRATTIPVGEWHDDLILKRGSDKDYYRFRLNRSNKNIKVRINFQDRFADVDMKLYKRRRGRWVTTESASGTHDSEKFTEHNAPAGWYLLKVFAYDHDFDHGNHVKYNLKIEID